MSQNFDLKTFTFEGHELRTKTIDGEPWLVAIDVLRALGVEVESSKGVHNKLLPLDEDERKAAAIPRQSLTGKRGNPAPNTTLISESGFYKLTMRAQRSNPTARKFQDWVTKDVLPALRKDGLYVMGEEKLKTGEVQIGDFFESMADAIRKKMNAAFEAQAALARALRSGWKTRNLRT